MQIIPNNAVFKQSVLKPQLNKLNASIKIIAFSSAGYGFFFMIQAINIIIPYM